MRTNAEFRRSIHTLTCTAQEMHMITCTAQEIGTVYSPLAYTTTTTAVASTAPTVALTVTATRARLWTRTRRASSPPHHQQVRARSLCLRTTGNHFFIPHFQKFLNCACALCLEDELRYRFSYLLKRNWHGRETVAMMQHKPQETELRQIIQGRHNLAPHTCTITWHHTHACNMQDVYEYTVTRAWQSLCYVASSPPSATQEWHGYASSRMLWVCISRRVYVLYIYTYIYIYIYIYTYT